MPQAIDCPAQNADVSAKENETLDPSDWKNLRTQAHHMLDDMLDYTEHIRERPVWQPCQTSRGRGFAAWFRGCRPILPPFMKSSCAMSCPSPQVMFIPALWAGCMAGYAGWHAGGNAGRGLNANLGGRDQAPIEVERQVVQWTREIFGFPETATGLFVTGTSMANLIAVVIARDVALGFEARRRGISAAGMRLTAYASTAVHGCIQKAIDLCGVGSDALRLVQLTIFVASTSKRWKKRSSETAMPALRPFGGRKRRHG